MKIISRLTILIILHFFAAGQVYPVDQKSSALDKGDKCLSFPGAMIGNVHTIHIPFRLVGRLIAVEGRIGDVSGNFLFDTGSEVLLLNRRYFGRGEVSSTASLGSSGIVESIGKSEIDTLHIDRLSVLNLNVHIVDLTHIESKKNIQLHGIIGYNVLKDFEVLIDYPSRIITLSRLDNSGNPLEQRLGWEQKSDSIRFYLRQHLITFGGRIGGKSLVFALDTGAELNLLDRLVGRKVLNHFEILKRVKMVGVGKCEIEVIAGLLREFKCGNQEPKEMHTLLTNLDDFNAAFRTSIHGVLGYEFLFDKRILINYKKERLYFLVPHRP